METPGNEVQRYGLQLCSLALNLSDIFHGNIFYGYRRPPIETSKDFCDFTCLIAWMKNEKWLP
jgi:hypothetical protein